VVAEVLGVAPHDQTCVEGEDRNGGPEVLRHLALGLLSEGLEGEREGGGERGWVLESNNSLPSPPR
jgi:hypothetical protein